MLLRTSFLVILLSTFSTVNAEIVEYKYMFEFSGYVTDSNDLSTAAIGDQINVNHTESKKSWAIPHEIRIGDSSSNINTWDEYEWQLHRETHITITNSKYRDYLTFDYYAKYGREDDSEPGAKFEETGYISSAITFVFDKNFFDDADSGEYHFSDWDDLDEEKIFSMLTDDILDHASSATGSYSKVRYYDTDHTNVKYEITDFKAIHPVPLPAAAWMFLSGIGGCITFRRKKKSATSQP
ncbi:MAG: hypothetical protein D6B28_07315 [Gammaproteobacteria bacterium]|nr:MAG: hypothetical protein D6B28_07315 [Gammaproteobacteria bacterium]